MARSATLNPASMPFFPGGIRASEEGGSGLALGHQIPTRDQDRSSMSSSFSISPSEYRSVRSSPSPPRDEHGGVLNDLGGGNRQSPVSVDIMRRSPTFRQGDAGRPYPAIESRVREASMLGSLESLPEGEDTPGPFPTNGHQASPSPFTSMQQEARGRTYTPPVPINQSNSSQGAVGVSFASASPVSSLDSGSQFAGSDHFGLEAQLRASPVIRGILERLQRCEYATSAIQRDLSDVNRKVSLLVERSLGMSGQPEFKDPFAPAANGSFTPSLGGHRPSIGNIAPNQSPPSDDISSISQRLNTLTTSVGQLLTLQTQQLQANLNNERILGSSNLSPPDIAPNQVLPSAVSNILGHGLPTRPDMRPSPRAPSLPMRTWSAGNLDLPMRPSEPNIIRTDAILRDKRRSVSGLLRRDSSGVLDLSSDSGSQRDSGPQISKWDQLALAPELLRSLSKFGVGPPNKIQQRALPFLLKGADIIAQAPPTQERIAAYVIPAIQIAVANTSLRPSNRGPLVVMISTTVDQATQAQRMIRDLGGPIGVRSALGVGATSANSDLTQELRLLQQSMPHIICGTPQKLHALFTSPGGLIGSEVRFLVLDEVDQLIARNLHEFVFNIVKLLPPPRSRPLSTSTPGGSATPTISQQPSLSSSFDSSSSVSPPIGSPFQPQGRRFSLAPSPNPGDQPSTTPQPIERQTALFSNTVPQDVLNLATAIQLREPVRVLVRRDGNVSQSESSQGSRGLRQYYLYLAFTAGGGRADPNSPAPGGGLGIIGSGRGASSAESAQAREWKLDALADLLDDIDVPQAIVHVGGMTALDSVVYKLASRGLEAVPLHGDMNAGTKLAALNKFRNSSSIIMRQPATKVLVVYDVQVKAPEVSHIPLVVNYDLPKAVEEYAHRVAPAIASNYARAGVVINFVTATGGDVEMLRSIECFYKIKCPEVPMSLRDIL